MMKSRPLLYTATLLFIGFISSGLQIFAAPTSEALEFKGFYRIPGDEYKFDVSNKDTQFRKWLKVGQRTGEYKLNRYEKAEKTHKLYFQDQNGEISTIELSNSSSDSLPLSQEQIFDSMDLRFRNGLYYILDSKTPVTGKVVKKYPGPKETRWYERSYKEGKKHGKTTEWFVNGEKKYEMFYDDNQRTGVWTYWDQNGKVTAKREYENNQFKRNLPLK